VALYRHYGHVEAPGKSTLFAEISKAVARDPVSIAFLAEMAPAKWQPNLLIAAVRYLYGTPPDARRFIERVHAHPDEIAAVMATRSTQTNEPARCATLLPLLAQLPQPLALLEVGASAGLCLWPDHYQYVYGRHRVRARVSPTEGEAPTFHCSADAATPLPRANVEVVWRAGLDLHPVDLDDAAEMRWLEALVWPGQLERLEGLRAASAVARQHPSPVIRGDLRRDLTDLAKLAPAGATLVIFTPRSSPTWRILNSGPLSPTPSQDSTRPGSPTSAPATSPAFPRSSKTAQRPSSCSPVTVSRSPGPTGTAPRSAGAPETHSGDPGSDEVHGGAGRASLGVSHVGDARLRQHGAGCRGRLGEDARGVLADRPVEQLDNLEHTHLLSRFGEAVAPLDPALGPQQPGPAQGGEQLLEELHGDVAPLGQLGDRDRV
jgi:hypothetical protein